MKTHVVVNTSTDASILRPFVRSFVKGFRERIVYVIAGARYRIGGVARSEMLDCQPRLLVLADADGDDPAEFRAEIESEIRWSALHDDWRVLIFEPCIDVLFFHDRGFLERFAGRAVTDAEFAAGRADPKAGLAAVLGGAVPAGEEMTRRMIEADPSPLRTHPVIAEMIAFLNAGPTATGAPAATASAGN